MNNAKIIGIANRIRVMKPEHRGPLLEELLAEIDSGPGYTANPLADPNPASFNQLRNMLEWPAIKNDPQMVTRIARALSELRKAK